MTDRVGNTMRPLLPVILATFAHAQDTDGDGLSDFQEVHKYFTDPAKRDTDGDGAPDADWFERREYAYTVRSIVRVMRAAQVICDDYQDARLLDATGEYVEMEVIHYPLNTVDAGITAAREWRDRADRPAEYLASTTTSNWDEGMRSRLLVELKSAGIDPGELDDRSFVEKAARFLLERSKSTSDFTAYFTRFVDGKPEIVPGLESAMARYAHGGLSLEERWQRDLFARGMFENRTHGSCTSSAIYLQGCLRALGIPTRSILVIPVIDASDPDEMVMVKRLKHNRIRQSILDALAPKAGNWTAHTFNEVLVGGRWCRLNYSRLGQNILDPSGLGLMTHIATFRDWAELHEAETVGRRQAGRRYDDAFGHVNPYSALTVVDRFGIHAKVDNPPLETTDPMRQLTIDRLIWSDAPEWKRITGLPPTSFALVARIVEWDAWAKLKRFTADADPVFFLEARGHPPIRLRTRVGGTTCNNTFNIHLDLSEKQRALLAKGVAYGLRARNEKPPYRWIVPGGLTTRRK